MSIFRDRREAGRQLAQRLLRYKDRPNTIVLALPRGGVPVGFEVAQALHLPLDVLLIRKLGLPHQEELAMGAIAEGDVRFLNEDVVRYWDIPQAIIDRVTKKETAELQRRAQLYRQGRPLAGLRGKTVILVDDGIATGAGMRAALRALAQQHPKGVVVAVPTAPKDFGEFFLDMADETVQVQPLQQGGVGAAYEDFSQTTDEEVIRLLEEAQAPMAMAAEDERRVLYGY
ncbi:MAG TPA: phosphoribosyltransferase [Alphaproteobacteria bacterium]|nr:phosphoribosyltransferase [Alphaproteobacteria bacterium]